MAVTRIRLRRGTAAAWAAADPVLARGEAGVDLDTGELRIGDGTAAWSTLTPIGAVDTADIAAAVEAYLIANPPAMGALTDLSDVTIGDSTEGDVLTLGPGGEWGPATIPAPDMSSYVQTTDARLSDARTPTAHKASHATGGTDALTAADIGAQPAGSYAAASHTQAASTISDSTAVGRSVLTAVDAAAARTAIGAGTSSFTGDYADLAGKPTLGTAAATAATDYATATQGTKADTALQPATGQPINAQTGTTYTLVAADAGKLVTLTNAAAITLTVPGSVFTAGQRVDCLVLGAGMVTAVGSGATVNGTPSLVSRGQWSAFTVLFTSATTAVVVGDLASS